MRRSVGKLTSLFALAACGGTEPVDLATSYTLSTVEGVVPPHLVAASLECDVTIGGGRVTFGPGEHFDLGLDVLTDCSRGGGSTSEATYGYTGSVQVSGRQVVFHTATGSGPVVYEGEVSAAGRLEVTVPGLVPLVEQVAVAFLPD